MNRETKKKTGNRKKHALRYFLGELMGNISIICSLMFLTFLIIDLFNGTAMFYASELAKTIILPLWMFSSIWAAVCIMITNRRRRKYNDKDAEHKHSHSHDGKHHHHSRAEGSSEATESENEGENA